MKMLGIVAVGVVKESRIFSGHTYIGRIARSSLRQHSFLVSKTCALNSLPSVSASGFKSLLIVVCICRFPILYFLFYTASLWPLNWSLYMQVFLKYLSGFGRPQCISKNSARSANSLFYSIDYLQQQIVGNFYVKQSNRLIEIIDDTGKLNGWYLFGFIKTLFGLIHD